MTHNAHDRPAEPTRATVRDLLLAHWKAFLVQGLVFMALGALAVIAPNIAAITAELFIGWLLFVVGVARIVALGTNRSVPGYWTSLLLGLATALLGLVLALWPASGLLTLTIALVAYLIAHGIGSIAIALTLRQGAQTWPWLILGGVVDLVLGVIILLGWPGTAAWVLGLLIGINLLFAGAGLIVVALGARAEAGH